MSNLWKKIDGIELQSTPYLNSEDECFYAKDYLPGTGFQGGMVNNDILNFKKSPSAQGQHYRTSAMYKFAVDASALFDCELRTNYTVTAIPSSKSKFDPLYDYRFEDFFRELSKLRPCLNIIWPVAIKNSVSATHKGGLKDPNLFKENYQFDGFKEHSPDFILVFDDVITKGAHFRAYKDFLIQSGYNGKIYGIFWAKTK